MGKNGKVDLWMVTQKQVDGKIERFEKVFVLMQQVCRFQANKPYNKIFSHSVETRSTGTALDASVKVDTMTSLVAILTKSQW